MTRKEVAFTLHAGCLPTQPLHAHVLFASRDGVMTRWRQAKALVCTSMLAWKPFIGWLSAHVPGLT